MTRATATTAAWAAATTKNTRPSTRPTPIRSVARRAASRATWPSTLGARRRGTVNGHTFVFGGAHRPRHRLRRRRWTRVQYLGRDRRQRLRAAQHQLVAGAQQQEARRARAEKNGACLYP